MPSAAVPLPVDGVRLSLWRAVAAYRVVTLAVCVFLVVRWHDLYARPAVAWAAAGGMVAVTAVVVRLAVGGRAHRRAVVAADVLATAVLTLASLPAQTPAQRSGDMPTLTTIWAAAPALEAGIVAGTAGGLVAAALQVAAAVGVRAGYDGRTLSSAVILLVAAAVTGYVAGLTVRAEAELAEASAARAAVAERERLARAVHDGVLQVLGLVHRTAADGADPRWSALGAEAARQEAALRALITSAPDPAGPGERDLAEALRALRSDTVTVSSAAGALPLPARVVGELAAAVRAALQNVAAHAGPDARAWVLLDADDSGVRITVRDDGPGIPAGRLEQAAAQGRLGVARSIRGRLTELGGHAAVTSDGGGTVVELVLPRPA